jgi:hypothetical protein
MISRLRTSPRQGWDSTGGVRAWLPMMRGRCSVRAVASLTRGRNELCVYSCNLIAPFLPPNVGSVPQSQAQSSHDNVCVALFVCCVSFLGECPSRSASVLYAPVHGLVGRVNVLSWSGRQTGRAQARHAPGDAPASGSPHFTPASRQGRVAPCPLELIAVSHPYPYYTHYCPPRPSLIITYTRVTWRRHRVLLYRKPFQVLFIVFANTEFLFGPLACMWSLLYEISQQHFFHLLYIKGCAVKSERDGRKCEAQPLLTRTHAGGDRCSDVSWILGELKHSGGRSPRSVSIKYQYQRDDGYDHSQLQSASSASVQASPDQAQPGMATPDLARFCHLSIKTDLVCLFTVNYNASPSATPHNYAHQQNRPLRASLQ